MNQKPKNKRRAGFNAVDAGILLIVLAVLLITVYFLFFVDSFTLDFLKEGGVTKTVRYTLTVSGIDNDLLNENGNLPIMKGDMLYHIDSSYTVGKVISVGDPTPHMAPTASVDQNGNLIYAAYPNKSDVTITVETTAILRDGAYEIDGKTLLVGETFTMATPYFTATALCSEAWEVTADE